MVAPLSEDLRRRVVKAHLAGEGTYAELAVRFSIGEATISRLLRRFRESGGVEPKEHGGGFPARIPDERLDDLRKLVAERPDRTKEELVAAWVERFGGTASTSSIGRALKRAAITRKKRPSPQPSNSGKPSKSGASRSRR